MHEEEKYLTFCTKVLDPPPGVETNVFLCRLLIYSLLLCIPYTILKQNSAKILNLKRICKNKKIIFQPITALVFEMHEMYPLIFSITKRNIPRFFQAFLIQMVFCYPNCSDLLWEKIVLVIEITRTICLNSERKVRTIFGNRMLSYLVPGDFLYVIN